MYIHDYTVSRLGEILSTRVHDTTRLLPAAVDVFRGLLARGGSSFDEPIPRYPDLRLRWTQPAERTAIATFWSGDVPLTTSALLGGIDPESDARACRAMAELLWTINDGVGMEAAPLDLVDADRPLIASAVIELSRHPRLPLVAEMETLLAAAFFDWTPQERTS